MVSRKCVVFCSMCNPLFPLALLTSSYIFTFENRFIVKTIIHLSQCCGVIQGAPAALNQTSWCVHSPLGTAELGFLGGAQQRRVWTLQGNGNWVHLLLTCKAKQEVVSVANRPVVSGT